MTQHDDATPPAVRFGLTLPNRAVVFGGATCDDLLDLAALADENPVWDSVWVGDSLLAKPRVDAIVLLSALAARTRRVGLGVACFASTPLRHPLVLAYQWANLDLLSGGRTIFVACQGQPTTGAGDFAKEFATFGVEPSSRMRRMEEAVEILRLAWSGERVSYDGEYTRFQDVKVLPRPAQPRVPIWLVANPVPTKRRNVESALRRVARYGDGWQTSLCTPQTFSTFLATIQAYASEEEGRLQPGFEASLYYNVNVNEDRKAAYAESKRFLDTYYETDWSREHVEMWVAHGSPDECIQQIRTFIEAGATTITLRCCSFDQRHQYDRVTHEILPALQGHASVRGSHAS